jgi:hypothetical protein
MRTAASLVLLLAALALAACGGDGDKKDDSATAGGHLMKKTLPAEIDNHSQTFASATVLHPVTNVWRTSSHRNFTQVEAGAAGADSSVGALLIFRHDFPSARQRSNVLKVIGSGPLRITKAPLGRGVEASAQRNGTIAFEGARGVRGELHLKDDTVSLLPPRPPG